MLYIKMIIFECNQLFLQTVTAEFCGLVDVIAKQKMIFGKPWILCQSLIKIGQFKLIWKSNFTVIHLYTACFFNKLSKNLHFENSYDKIILS